MYILYIFEAVYIAHDISLEKKGLECNTSLQIPKIEQHRPGIEPGPPVWQAGTLPKELSTL